MQQYLVEGAFGRGRADVEGRADPGLEHHRQAAGGHEGVGERGLDMAAALPHVLLRRDDGAQDRRYHQAARGRCVRVGRDPDPGTENIRALWLVLAADLAGAEAHPDRRAPAARHG